MDQRELQQEKPFSPSPLVTPKKAIWAIDPYDYEHLPHLEALQEIQSYLGGSFSETAPVFISGPQDLGIFSVNEKIQEFLNRYPLRHFQDAQVIKTESPNKKVWADLLIRAALEFQAEAIILSSHGKKGLSKFLVGSFAESLLEVSPLPIFFLSSEPQSRSDQVLFATDFSEDSKKAFFELLRMMNGSNKELILFHAIALPATSIGVPHFGGEMDPTISGTYWMDQSRWAESESIHWMQEAQNLGFKVRFHSVIEEAMSRPGDAVLHFAERENVSLIALVSHGRSKGKIFFGSVTKDVLASKRFNIWACGPNFRLDISR